MILHFICRFLWYDGWRSKADSVFQSLGEYFLLKDEGLMLSDVYFIFLFICRLEFTFFFFSESVVAGVKKEWVNCWDSLGSICLNAAELGHALRTGKKNRKRRAFTDLLKMLEACGLSKHRPVNTMVLERFVCLLIL